MKCHYEVLGISIDATDDEIKKGYRKLALYWHPDKNLDRIEECTKQFHLIQQAYDILTDPQERAWYDKHREAILRGGQGHGEHYKDDSMDVYQYFNTCCYSGYGDGEEGFYTIYRGVFETVAQQDQEFADDEDFEAPGFGDSQSSYEEVVGAFYACWESYCTAKSYVWVEEHDTRQAPNRLVRRAMEQENKKLRDKARKERNEEVRALVAFVKKRDRRVKAYKEKLEQRALEIGRLTEEKKQRQRQERLKSLEGYKESDWSAMSETDLEQLEANVAQQFGETCKVEDSDDPDDVEVFDDEDLFCVACNKLFKTEKAFTNHEKSKRHKDNVLLLQAMMEEEEGEEGEDGEEEGALSGDETRVMHDTANSSGSDQDVLSGEELSEDSEPQPAVKSKKSKKQKKRLKQQQKLQNLSKPDEETQPTDPSPDVNDRVDSVSSAVDVASSDSTGDGTGVTAEVAAQVGDREENSIETVTQPIEVTAPDEDNDRLSEHTEHDGNVKENGVAGSACDETPLPGHEVTAENEKAKINTNRMPDKQVRSTPQLCEVCRKTFPSRNKLFDHIKTTGHARRKEPAEVPTCNDDFGKKRKKKKGKK